jgi:1-acyl-sn-glycerol-3-phosphate acyltransferase
VLYRFFHLLIWAWMRVFHRLTVRGLHHVPPAGGALLAANHANFLDPVYVGCAVAHRPVTFMSVSRVGRIPLLGVFLRAVNTMTILHVGGFNRGAMREFSGALGEGRLLLVFPEGHRTSDGEMQGAQRGVGTLALAAGVQVIPALVIGAYKIWPRTSRVPIPWGRVEVRFGPPVTAAEAATAAQAGEAPDAAFARLVMERIVALRGIEDPALGFVAGGRMILRGG